MHYVSIGQYWFRQIPVWTESHSHVFVNKIEQFPKLKIKIMNGFQSSFSHNPHPFPSKLTTQKGAEFLLPELTWSKIFIKTVRRNPRVYLKAAHHASGVFNTGNVHSRIKTYKISQENSGKVVGFSLILVSLMLTNGYKTKWKIQFLSKAYFTDSPNYFFSFLFTWQRVRGVEELAPPTKSCHQRDPLSPVVSLNFSLPIWSRVA